MTYGCNIWFWPDRRLFLQYWSCPRYSMMLYYNYSNSIHEIRLAPINFGPENQGVVVLKRMALVMMAALLFVFPGTALGFDCWDPPFGADLKDLNQDGTFIKYMEKGGVSYYNYTGACSMPIHKFRNPSVAWAFVDNQLYARIIKIGDNASERMEKLMSIKYGPPMRVSEEGDWVIMIWKTDRDEKKLKQKYNKKTKEVKNVAYYEPLREKLEQGEKDPLALNVD